MYFAPSGRKVVSIQYDVSTVKKSLSKLPKRTSRGIIDIRYVLIELFAEISVCVREHTLAVSVPCRWASDASLSVSLLDIRTICIGRYEGRDSDEELQAPIERVRYKRLLAQEHCFNGALIVLSQRIKSWPYRGYAFLLVRAAHQYRGSSDGAQEKVRGCTGKGAEEYGKTFGYVRGLKIYVHRY